MDSNEDSCLHLNPSLASGDFFFIPLSNLSATCCHGSIMSEE